VPAAVRDGVDRSHAGGGGAGRHCPQGHRPQDRRARSALDHGRYPARHHVRPAEPRRRRGGRDLERGRRGYRAAALHLCRPDRPGGRRERIVGRALPRAPCETLIQFSKGPCPSMKSLRWPVLLIPDWYLEGEQFLSDLDHRPRARPKKVGRIFGPRRWLSAGPAWRCAPHQNALQRWQGRRDRAPKPNKRVSSGVAPASPQVAYRALLERCIGRPPKKVGRIFGPRRGLWLPAWPRLGHNFANDLAVSIDERHSPLRFIAAERLRGRVKRRARGGLG